jgi:hypothetical protein
MSGEIIRVGDRFEITVEVSRTGDHAFACKTTRGDVVHFTRDELLSGKRLSRPLAVGDRVRISDSIGEVLALDGGFAWIKFGAVRGTYAASALTPDLTPAPDKEA